MQKILVAVSLGVLLIFQTPHAEALSCVTLDIYLESVLEDEATQIFIGTATKVKDHTQVVAVSEALKGWVPREVWVQHPFSKDWQYLCSNGPAKAGEPTLFFTTLDQYGARSVVQTLDMNLSEAKEFIKRIERAGVESGITEATAVERSSELLGSINDMLKALMNLIQEFRYWQSAR